MTTLLDFDQSGAWRIYHDADWLLETFVVNNSLFRTNQFADVVELLLRFWVFVSHSLQNAWCSGPVMWRVIYSRLTSNQRESFHVHFEMPAFQSLPVNKRKYDDDEPDVEVSRKRISTNSLAQTGRENENEVWMVQWYYSEPSLMVFHTWRHSVYRRNPQYKKHKTWDGDGVLVSSGSGESTLYDTDGQMYVVVMPAYLSCSEGREAYVRAKSRCRFLKAKACPLVVRQSSWNTQSPEANFWRELASGINWPQPHKIIQYLCRPRSSMPLH